MGASGSDFITNIASQTISGTLSAALAAGETVQFSLDNGASWTSGAATIDSTTFSIPGVILAGSNVLKVRVVDGTDAGAAAQRAYVLDTTAPAVTIASSASTLKAGETATITFTFSEDPGSTFDPGDVLVTGGTVGSISGTGLTRTAIFTPSADTNAGTASITVAASSYEDVAGNSGSAGASPSLVFDTQVPTAPSTPVLIAASDTGASDSDGITNDNTPTFSGTAASGSVVTLYDSDGATALGSATAIGGTWSITALPLTPGTHTLTAKASDAAGNSSAASGPLSLTIDTSAPSVAISSNATTLKAGETATVTFTFSEDPGATFTWNGTAGDVVVSGGTLGALSGTGLTRTATFTPAPDTNGGTASITVAAGSYQDLAGNSGGAGTTPSLTFDTLAPGAPSVPDLEAVSDSGASNSDNLTNITTPTFTGSAESGSTVTLYDTDGTTALGTTVADGGNWSITSSILAAGAHNITAKVTDAAGNTGVSSAALVVTIDTARPTGTIALSDNALTVGETSIVTFSFSEAVTGFTISDVTVENGVLSGLSSANGGATWTATLTPSANVSDATNIITLDQSGVSDSAGNAGLATAVSGNYTVQTVISTPPAPTPIVNPGTPGNDIVFGGDANDSVSGGQGADYVYGGAGNDAVYGNQGNDVVFGGLGSDSVYGGQDNDVVYGGNSGVDTNDGADEVYGGRGNDVAYGNAGDDKIFGGEGSDTAYGGQGSDVMYGGEGVVSTDDAADLLYGGFGNDVIYGNFGDDQLFGNQGDDIIFGGQGNDFIHGGQGNDTLTGGVGNDTLTGGLGADRFMFAQGGGNDRIEGFNHREGDRIDLGGQSFTRSFADGNTILTLGDGGSITLIGTDAGSALF